MSKEEVSRRNFIKFIVTGVVCGVVAGVGGYFSGIAAAPPPKTVTVPTTIISSTTVTETKTVTAVPTSPKPTTPASPTPKWRPRGSYTRVKWPDLHGKTITYLAIDPHKVYADLTAKKFEALTGCKVKVMYIPFGKEYAKWALDVKTGAREIDVVQETYAWVPKLIEEGLAEDITDFVHEHWDEIEPEDFVPVCWEYYTGLKWNGKIYGLPYDGDVHVLSYRPSIIEKFGLKLDTWVDHFEAVKTITENMAPEMYGTSIMGIPIWEAGIGNHFVNRMLAYGGDYFKDMDPHKGPAIDSPECVAALQNLIDEIPYMIPGTLSFSFDEHKDAYFHGKTAMMENWPDIACYRAKNPAESELPPEDVRIKPLPKGPPPKGKLAPALNVGWANFVSSASKHKEAAKYFVMFASSYEAVMGGLIGMGGMDCVRMSEWEDPMLLSWDPNYVEVDKWSMLNGKIAYPWIPECSELQDKLIVHIYKAIEGKVDAETALRNVAEEWDTILRKAGYYK